MKQIIVFFSFGLMFGISALLAKPNPLCKSFIKNELHNKICYIPFSAALTEHENADNFNVDSEIRQIKEEMPLQPLKIMACNGLTPIKEFPAGFISTNTTGGIYALNNNVAISGAVTLIGVELLIDSNVSISVPAGSTLTLINCYFHACNDMWKGITVFSDGSLRILNNSQIEDAIIAVSTNFSVSTGSTSQIFLQNSIFNKNRVGLSIGNYLDVTGGFYPFRVEDCVFTCRTIGSVFTGLTVAALKAPNNPITSPLESPYIDETVYLPTTLKPPYATFMPETAIRLDDVGDTQTPFGTPSYSEMLIGSLLPKEYNVIDLHSFGIKAWNANFTSVNNVFQHSILGVNNGLGSYDGYGIYAHTDLRSRCSVAPLGGTGTHNRFYDCKRGIFTRNYYELLVYNSLFCGTQTSTQPVGVSPSEFGVWASSSYYLLHDVSLDTIYNVANGISLFATLGTIIGPGGGLNSQFLGDIFANRNIIQPHPDISLISTEYVNNAITVDNDLTTTTAAGTVVVANTNTTYINNNIIQQTYRGIRSNNWRERYLISKENYISLRDQSSSFFTAEQYGGMFINDFGVIGVPLPVNTFNSVYKWIYNNYVDGFGVNPPAMGFVFGQDAEIEIRCNTTNNTEQGFVFRSPNISTNTTYFWDNIMQNNSFGYTIENGAIIGAQGTSANPSDNFWVGVPGVDWTSTGPYMTFANNAPSVLSPLYVRNVANYNPNGFGFGIPIALTYINPTSILYASPNAFRPCNAPPTLPAFNSTTSNSANLIMEWEKIALGTMPYYGNVSATQFQYEQQLYELLTKDTTWCDSSAVLDSFYIANANSEYYHLYEIGKVLASGNWSNVQNLLAANQAQNVVSIAQTSYYSLAVKSIVSSFDATDSLALTDLAQLCGSEMGWVVSAAQSLYNAYYITNIAFTENCNSQANTRIKHSLTTDIAIIPNPTNGVFSIQLDKPLSNYYSISIQNMQGQEVMQKEIRLTQKEATIETGLPQGIYIIHLYNIKSNENYTQKLIIY